MCLSSSCPSQLSHTQLTCVTVQSFNLNKAYTILYMDGSIHPPPCMGAYTYIHNTPTICLTYCALPYIYVSHKRACICICLHTHTAVVFFGKKVPAVLFVHTPLDNNTVSLTCMDRGCHAVISIWSLARGDLHYRSWETSAELDQLSEAVQRGMSLSPQGFTDTVV